MITLWLIALVIAPLAAVSILTSVVPARYVWLSVYKLVYLVPFFQRQNPWCSWFSLATFRKLWRLNVSLAVLVAAIYLGAFYLLAPFIDVSGLLSRVSAAFSFTPQSIVPVGIYIIFINSFLEEVFWRGYIFDGLRSRIHPLLAHAIGAVGFASYHLYFIRSWISVPLLVLVFIGLALFAIVMNLHYRKHRDLFSLWFIHIFADAAQMFIAFKLFGVL